MCWRMAGAMCDLLNKQKKVLHMATFLRILVYYIKFILFTFINTV
jgi:hypothetical protein